MKPILLALITLILTVSAHADRKDKSGQHHTKRSTNRCHLKLVRPGDTADSLAGESSTQSIYTPLANDWFDEAFLERDDVKEQYRYWDETARNQLEVARRNRDARLPLTQRIGTFFQRRRIEELRTSALTFLDRYYTEQNDTNPPVLENLAERTRPEEYNFATTGRFLAYLGSFGTAERLEVLRTVSQIMPPLALDEIINILLKIPQSHLEQAYETLRPLLLTDIGCYNFDVIKRAVEKIPDVLVRRQIEWDVERFFNLNNILSALIHDSAKAVAMIRNTPGALSSKELKDTIARLDFNAVSKLPPHVVRSLADLEFGKQAKLRLVERAIDAALPMYQDSLQTLLKHYQSLPDYSFSEYLQSTEGGNAHIDRIAPENLRPKVIAYLEKYGTQISSQEFEGILQLADRAQLEIRGSVRDAYRDAYYLAHIRNAKLSELTSKLGIIVAGLPPVGVRFLPVGNLPEPFVMALLSTFERNHSKIGFISRLSREKKLRISMDYFHELNLRFQFDDYLKVFRALYQWADIRSPQGVEDFLSKMNLSKNIKIKDLYLLGQPIGRTILKRFSPDVLLHEIPKEEWVWFLENLPEGDIKNFLLRSELRFW